MKIAKNFVDACYEAGVAIHKEELGELAILTSDHAVCIRTVTGLSSSILLATTFLPECNPLS